MSNRSPEEIQADIEQQRERLARTVDQLGDELQAKAQSTAKVAAVAAGVGLLVLVAVWWRRRS